MTNSVIPCSKGPDCNWPACPQTCPERPGSRYSMTDLAEHKLADGTLRREEQGIVGRCTCGWSTGYRFSSLAASAAFQEHQEECGIGEARRR